MKRLITILIVLGFSGLAFGQNEESKPKDKAVWAPFESGYLIDNQTTVVPTAKTLEYIIQHKFGTMDNGFSDLFGLYAPGANIRMGLTYSVIKNLQIGYGITRLNMYNDFSAKYTILEQTRRNTIPVAVAIYANIGVDGRNNEVFGENYKGSDRFSYFTQLIVGRKVNDWLSLQVNTSFTHYNKTDSLIDHDKISVGINGRARFSPQSSILFQYDVPLKIKGIAEHREFTNPSKPNLGVGWEIRTSTHAFHIYVSTAAGIIPQHNAMFNQNDWMDGDLMIGFSITRMWSF
ncbi:MAG: hypothetical protein KJ578_10845 [Bacteroidetes bacterium]|nr:hypothetical protein [Bacteroidota bacterium]MBU1578247.1 hypothetical protein [Bacteroidota bacterium]MBU2558265.1 hypothetical protein [Bacteroidota bacterium]